MPNMKTELSSRRLDNCAAGGCTIGDRKCVQVVQPRQDNFLSRSFLMRMCILGLLVVADEQRKNCGLVTLSGSAIPRSF